MPVRSETTVNEYLAYLGDRGHSSRTVIQYRHKLLQFLAWLGDDELTQGSLTDYRRHMQDRGLRPRTVRVAFTAIRSYFDYLRLEEQVADLPDARAVKLPRMDPPQREVPTDEELGRIWNAVGSMPKHTARARFLHARTVLILSIFAYTGLRRSEMLSLDVGDVQTEYTPWRLMVRRGKGGQSRWIPLNDEANAAFRAWLEVRRQWCEEHGCQQFQALIPVDRRRRLSHRGLKALWDELMDRAGLLDHHYTPHGIRHFFATAAAEVTDLPTVSALLGHSRVETTLRYLHSNPKKMEAAVQRLGQFGAGKTAAETKEVGPAGSQPASPAASSSHRAQTRSRTAPRHDTPSRRRISRT